MIAVFALVCVILAGVLISFMSSGKKKEDNNETN
jgi:type II secretory pathway pseudopilin PulG